MEPLPVIVTARDNGHIGVLVESDYTTEGP